MSRATGWAWRVFGLVVVLAGVAPAADVSWPQWRGARRDGVSPDKGLLQ